MKISAMPTTKRLSLPFNGRVCFKCVWWILVSFTYWPSCGHLHITKWKNWALRYQAPRDTRKINDTWSLNPKVFKTFFVLQFFFTKIMSDFISPKSNPLSCTGYKTSCNCLCPLPHHCNAKTFSLFSDNEVSKIYTVFQHFGVKDHWALEMNNSKIAYIFSQQLSVDINFILT